MIFYRGKDFTELEKELQEIIELAENNPDLEKESLFQVFKSPDFLRPFKCVGLLTILLNMSVVLVIDEYTHIFLEVQKCIIILVFCN